MEQHINGMELNGSKIAVKQRIFQLQPTLDNFLRIKEQLTDGSQWIVNNNRIHAWPPRDHVHTPNNPCNICDTVKYPVYKPSFAINQSSASASAKASADASGNGEANANAKATANGSGAWATASSDAKTISLGK